MVFKIAGRQIRIEKQAEEGCGLAKIRKLPKAVQKELTKDALGNLNYKGKKYCSANKGWRNRFRNQKFRAVIGYNYVRRDIFTV